MQRLIAALVLACAACAGIPRLPSSFRYQVSMSETSREEFKGTAAGAHEFKTDANFDVQFSGSTVRVTRYQASGESSDPSIGRIELGASLAGTLAEFQWTSRGTLRPTRVLEGKPTPKDLELLEAIDVEHISCATALKGLAFEPGARKRIDRKLSPPPPPKGVTSWSARFANVQGELTLAVREADAAVATLDLSGDLSAVLEFSADKATGRILFRKTVRGVWRVDRRLGVALERTEETTTDYSGQLNDRAWKRSAVEKVSYRVIP